MKKRKWKHWKRKRFKHRLLHGKGRGGLFDIIRVVNAPDWFVRRNTGKYSYKRESRQGAAFRCRVPVVVCACGSYRCPFVQSAMGSATPLFGDWCSVVGDWGEKCEVWCSRCEEGCEGIRDWGLGIGEWGLGIGDSAKCEVQGRKVGVERRCLRHTQNWAKLARRGLLRPLRGSGCRPRATRRFRAGAFRRGALELSFSDRRATSCDFASQSDLRSGYPRWRSAQSAATTFRPVVPSLLLPHRGARWR